MQIELYPVFLDGETSFAKKLENIAQTSTSIQGPVDGCSRLLIVFAATTSRRLALPAASQNKKVATETQCLLAV